MPARASLVAVITALGLLAGSAGAVAAPSPTPPTPAGPLPVELHVTPDSDVLGRPGVHVAEGMSPPPAPIPATAYLISDVDTGNVLLAQNARARLLPASTLKVLTALALSPELPDGRAYRASEEAAGIEGSKVGLVAGSDYTVRDLMFGLLLSSGNDTAIGLHELVGGQPQAAALMNATAARLGASDTFAVNTSGLDGPGQFTSARDLAILARAMLDDPRISAVATTKLYDFPDRGTAGQPDRGTYQIANHNRMLGVYPGATGGKTGYTLAARGTFIGSADRDGRRLSCTVLHSEGLEHEHCTRLLDWAYSQPAPTQPVTTLAASIQASAPPTTEPPGDVGTATGGTPAAPSDESAPGNPPAWWAPVLGGGAIAVGAAWLWLRRWFRGRRVWDTSVTGEKTR